MIQDASIILETATQPFQRPVGLLILFPATYSSLQFILRPGIIRTPAGQKENSSGFFPQRPKTNCKMLKEQSEISEPSSRLLLHILEIKEITILLLPKHKGWSNLL